MGVEIGGDGTVSKGEFARLSNVTPGRVSQWIGEGKIDGDALVGDGRAARVHVERARQQLRRYLDIGQRLGNGLSTDLGHPASAPSPPPSSGAPPAPSVPVTDPIEERIKQERLEQLQRQNRRAAVEEAAHAGHYVDRGEAERQVVAIADQLLRLFEGSLTELATAVAAKFQVPQRDVLHLMRGEFREVRLRAADNMRRRAEGVPAVTEIVMPAAEEDAAA